MDLPLHSIINGRPCRSRLGKRLPLIDPSTEDPFSEVDLLDAADMDEAVQGAAKAFHEWRDLPPGKRAELLFKVSHLIRKEAEALAQLESRNVGKPIRDAREEIALGARIFEYYAGAVSLFTSQVIPVARGGFDFTLRQPMGVVGAIVPWNFPFPIACWKVAPALAAGNSVVLKPAQLTPLTALRLGELVLEAGIPAGVLQVVVGLGEEVGEVLVQHPKVRKISFTGSTAVGIRIMEKAARDLKRVSLELGGKSPNIVFADADLEKAASAAPLSVFSNTGQDCCARSRIFVERKIFDSFVERFVASTRKLIIGAPSDPATQLGPLITQKQRETVESFLATGGRLICGGNRPSSKGFYLEPAILTDITPESRAWREEIFGPVVCLRPFETEEEMIQEVNASPFGLSGSIWTNHLPRALRVARRVESGVLSINSHSSVHVEAPFGGYKMSGMGRDLGMAAMEGYTELKNIYIAEEPAGSAPEA